MANDQTRGHMKRLMVTFKEDFQAWGGELGRK